jgi:phage/plasmid-associated DNA primase
MILTCNHLPTVPSDDGGTWRRIRVVEFKSRFVHDPNPKNEEEYKIDLDLPLKFEEWKEAFMYMLLQRHNKISETGFLEPEEVIGYTRAYQKQNDTIAEFIDDTMVKEQGNFIQFRHIYEDFKDWMKENNPSVKVSKKSEAQKAFERQLGAIVNVRGTPGFSGWAFKSYENDDMDDF